MLPKHLLRTSTICLAVVLLVGMALPVPPARLAEPGTFTVCATDCDFTTIQAALDDDCVVAGDTIQVMDAVHTEAGITVRQDVTIQGQGAAKTIVQAHATAKDAPNRVFLVEEGATIVIKDMTIRHGHQREYPRSGGGIANHGTLTLESCIVTDNVTNDGGGIWNYAGTMTLINCTVSGNQADRIAEPVYACGSGAGIKNGRWGTLALVNCTISDNQALGKGGGLFASCESTTTLTNCTISGNQAATFGGGLYVAKAVLRLTHCTISHNRATVRGGGVYVRGTLDMTNTIIANSIRGKDCATSGHRSIKGTIRVNTNNLIEDGSKPAAYTGDPMLGDLANNGPSTSFAQHPERSEWTGHAPQTHALLPGSPAIDVIPAGECSVTTDQRGLPRPVACTSPDTPGDLGAFEVQADECVPPTPSPTATSTPRPLTATPVPATPTPTPRVVPALPNNLLPVWSLLGVLILALAGLIILWLRRRRS